MRIPGSLNRRKAVLGLAVLIVGGGVLLALGSYLGTVSGTFGSFSASPSASLANAANNAAGSYQFGATNVGPGNTVVLGPGSTETVSTVTESTTTAATSATAPGVSGANATQGSPTGGGGLIEFSSDIALQSKEPQQAASGIVALAYSVGGYVAYQSTYPTSANVVVRVPASEYQQVLAKIEEMGTVEGLTSNSNDVRVQYTDLNATLESLRTEQGALLRLLNQSSTVNSTLSIETQLQGVDQQINDIESQILQTRTLIQYSTIDVTIAESPQAAPLSMSVTATPRSGVSPLSVTFNAVVKGGAQPYVVNYNFGDGYASEGQIVIHTYFQPGEYNVTVAATDQNGTSSEQSLMVRVAPAPGESGISGFLGTVSGLFVSVVEGIVEVAAVVLPIAGVGAAIIVPIQRHGRNQKVAKQTQ